MPFPIRIKDPEAVLDYTFIWTNWLIDDDTLSTHTVVASNGLTVDSSAINGSAVTIDDVEYAANTVVIAWLSGGTSLKNYTVTCHVTTANNRIDDRSMTIQCRER